MELRTLIDEGMKLWDGWSYPIFDEAYRETLNQKIVDHFYFREIGFETPGKFLFKLKTRMNEIMPYFNKMYSAQNLEQRILDNYDVTETYTRTVTDDGTITDDVDSTQNSKQLFSDTPAGRLDLTSIGNGEQLTSINDDTDTNTGTNTRTLDTTQTENYTLTKTGNIGVQTDAHGIMEYNKSLVNVDLEVFQALNDLFMLVY